MVGNSDYWRRERRSKTWREKGGERMLRCTGGRKVEMQRGETKGGEQGWGEEKNIECTGGKKDEIWRREMRGERNTVL